MRITKISLIGMSLNGVKPTRYFQDVIKLVDEEYPLTVYVMPDGSTPLNAAIDNDITAKTRVTIEPDHAVISKINPTVLAYINVAPEKVFEVSHVKDPKMRSEVESLIESYGTKKIKFK